MENILNLLKGCGGGLLKRLKSVRFWLVLAGAAAVVFVSFMLYFQVFTHSVKTLYWMFFDSLTLLWMLVVTWFWLYLARMHMDFVKGFRLAFSNKKGISRMELQRSAKAMGYVQKIVILEGIIAFMIPMIEKMYYDSIDRYDDYVSFVMVEMISMGLLGLCVLYPAIIVLVLEPVKSRLTRKVISYMEEPEGDEEKEAQEQKLFFKLRAMGLTDREAEIARLVCAEMSNVEIGRQLFIADSTVKKHITHILGKTGCADRKELAVKVKADA